MRLQVTSQAWRRKTRWTKQTLEEIARCSGVRIRIYHEAEYSENVKDWQSELVGQSDTTHALSVVLCERADAAGTFKGHYDLLLFKDAAGNVYSSSGNISQSSVARPPINSHVEDLTAEEPPCEGVQSQASGELSELRDAPPSTTVAALISVAIRRLAKKTLKLLVPIYWTTLSAVFSKTEHFSRGC
eukprot:TRINITY_DN17_c2_g1_i2.p1 TRINITY_DN17_c2_g1~~TRINITY_DN17_c2_g1_i2.p1  ORF type:complete len:187 (+),score=19.38 TRINITY_DN17_c2_g1_i2:139-699(+)